MPNEFAHGLHIFGTQLWNHDVVQEVRFLNIRHDRPPRIGVELVREFLREQVSEDREPLRLVRNAQTEYSVRRNDFLGVRRRITHHTERRIPLQFGQENIVRLHGI